MPTPEIDIEPPAPERPPRSVGFLISQLGFFSSRRFATALEPVGITPRDFLVMRFIAVSEGQSQQELATRLGLPASRMVAVVDNLEQHGLAERRLDASDRRIRALHLTAKGREVLERAIAVAVEYETDLCAPLANGEREKLIDLLLKIQAAQTTLRGVHPGMAEENHDA